MGPSPPAFETVQPNIANAEMMETANFAYTSTFIFGTRMTRKKQVTSQKTPNLTVPALVKCRPWTHCVPDPDDGREDCVEHDIDALAALHDVDPIPVPQLGQ